MLCQASGAMISKPRTIWKKRNNKSTKYFNAYITSGKKNKLRMK